VNFFGRQGYPNPYYVRTRAVDAAGNSHRYLTQIAQVDTYRYDNVYELDFRLAKTFTIGGVTIVPAAELFNVANANTVLQRRQRVGDYRIRSGEPVFAQSAFFNDIIEVQSPRIVRLGIAVNFRFSGLFGPTGNSGRALLLSASVGRLLKRIWSWACWRAARLPPPQARAGARRNGECLGRSGTSS
jgi:hypothetical protein